LGALCRGVGGPDDCGDGRCLQYDE
jgi:hypothetical protein